MIQDIYDHSDQLDLEQAFSNLVYNTIEDAIIGGARGRHAQALRDLGVTSTKAPY